LIVIANPESLAGICAAARWDRPRDRRASRHPDGDRHIRFSALFATRLAEGGAEFAAAAEILGRRWLWREEPMPDTITANHTVAIEDVEY
jgi:hypothetical protein